MFPPDASKFLNHYSSLRMNSVRDYISLRTLFFVVILVLLSLCASSSLCVYVAFTVTDHHGVFFYFFLSFSVFHLILFCCRKTRRTCDLFRFQSESQGATSNTTQQQQQQESISKMYETKITKNKLTKKQEESLRQCKTHSHIMRWPYCENLLPNKEKSKGQNEKKLNISWLFRRIKEVDRFSRKQLWRRVNLALFNDSYKNQLFIYSWSSRNPLTIEHTQWL